MEKIVKKIVLITGLFFLWTSMSCEGLYDLAKNGLGLVYIVTKDGIADTRLIVTTGEDYYKVHYIANIPNIIEGLFVTERKEVFLLRTAGLDYSSGNYYDWKFDPAPPFFGAGTVIHSKDEKKIAVTSLMEVYNLEQTGWVLKNTFTNPPINAYCFDGDGIYCVGNANTIQQVYITDFSLFALYNSAPTFDPAAPGGTFFAYKSGSSFYIGGGSALFLDSSEGGRTSGIFTRLGNDFNMYIPGASAQSFAIVEGADIFAGLSDGSELYLYRYKSGNWENVGLPFSPAAAPLINIYPLKKGKIVIWARIIPEAGVYIYDYEKDKLKKLEGFVIGEVLRVQTSQ